MEFEKLRDIIVDTLGCESEDVKPEARLAEELGADSLAAVELIMSLEENAGVHIEDEDAAKLKTVGDIIAYLNTHKE